MINPEGNRFERLKQILGAPAEPDPRLTQYAGNVHFAMEANGFKQDASSNWKFVNSLVSDKINEFKGQQTTFFGPDKVNEVYAPTSTQKPERFEPIFRERAVVDAIHDVKQQDPHAAERLAFILGGVVRERWLEQGRERNANGEIRNAVGFCADMVKLGDPKSSDATATAMAMFVRSSRNFLLRDSWFEGNIAKMAKAVSEDTVGIRETSDLGMSQLERLRRFSNQHTGNPDKPLPDISAERAAIAGMPTVGAEFHLWPNETPAHPNFWERVALLNMSQYHPDSYVQMSRDDRDVVEIRMNPAEYPITVANWQYMRTMLPELNKAFFTVTLNTQQKDFSWDNSTDSKFLQKLKALGYLSYSSLMSDLPPTSKSAEIDFGTAYLGQTVKVKNGEVEFSGLWSGGTGGRGTCGQLGLYIGYGDVFPDLAYYLSMGMADPNTVLRNTEGTLDKATTLREAMQIDRGTRRRLFDGVRNRIANKHRLNNISEAGESIIEKYAP